MLSRHKSHGGKGRSNHHRDKTARISRNGFPSDGLLFDLVERLGEGVVNLSPQGDILYANPRFADLLGAHSSQSLRGTKLRKYLSPASWEPLAQALNRAMKAPTQGELTVEIASGKPRTVRVFLRPFHGGKGTTVNATATEVTELLAKAKALEESEASLHTLSARILQLQDEERRRIARDLHDITGQELAVVVMSLSQMAKNLDQPAQDQRKAIADAVGLVRKVEDEIRTLSYLLHPPLLDEFGLGSALNWYTEGFEKRSGVKIQVQSPPDLPRFSAEKETALFRVVQEGLTNVLRHSGSAKARIRISCDGENISLSVEDEGRGIGEKKLAGCGEGGHGTGVGILGMRERLQQLGGTLTIRSAEKGTQLVAELPVQESARGSSASASMPATAAEKPPRGAAHAAPALVKKRILIADDHEVTRKGIKSLLKDEPDLEVCGEAEDGVDAIVKTSELKPDLIIMDLNMPRLAGFSAANKIRSAGGTAKILFFSMHSFGQLERMSEKAGFEGFVYKANAAQDLLRGIRAVLADNRFFNSQVIQATPPHVDLWPQG